MRHIRWALVAAVCLHAVGTAHADRIRLLTGGSVRGEVTATSADGVTIVDIDGRSQTVAVDQIRSVIFEGEPIALTQARQNAANGGYETALETLSEINASTLSDPRLKTEVAFLKAYSAARLAQFGDGDPRAAVGGLTAFARSGKASHHYYKAVETLGDLAIAIGRPEQAERFYGALARSSVASMKSCSLMLLGEAFHAAEEYTEAIKRFDAALADREATRETRRRATFGKATSLAAAGQAPAALEVVRRVIAATGAEQKELLAAGYNALGRCYEATGESTDALLAYLHTDLLFDGDAATHAEALARLAVLWKAAGKPDEADSAARRLRGRYAQTEWARQTRARSADD